MSNLRISSKILMIIGLFGTLAAALTMFGALGVWTMKSSLDSIADDQFSSLKVAAMANEKATRRHQLAFEILAESTPADRTKLQSEFVTETQNMNQLLDEFRPFVDGADVPRFAAIEDNFKSYNDMELKLYAMLGNGQREAAEDFVQTAMSDVFDKSDGAFDELVKQQADDVDTAQVVADTTSGRVYLALIAGAVSGSACIAGFALWIARRQIIQPIDALARDMSGLARGDLSIAVTGRDRGDEIGGMARAVEIFKQAGIAQKRMEGESVSAREEAERLRIESERRATTLAREAFVSAVRPSFQSLSRGDLTTRLDPNQNADYVEVCELFNDSVSQLEETVGSVVGAIGAIRTGLREITVASNDLSQRTEQQAASLEETVAALGEVTQGINETAKGAGQAQSAAATTQKNAERGGEIVGRAVAAMAEIEKSSDQIGKIIGVIDEIAFQTNLLALNAGVEAARAGEAGRGFAVVAQEVRGLAQRSAEAAKEIKNLISLSSTQVVQGVELVTASGRSLEEIVAQVAHMSGVVSQIASSARAQATSLKEVSTAADQMDKVTQQNAAMVEETTAAAQSLTGETDELAALVERFKTKAVAAAMRSSAGPAAKKPAARPVAQMRTTGGASPKPAAAKDTWEEF